MPAGRSMRSTAVGVRRVDPAVGRRRPPPVPKRELVNAEYAKRRPQRVKVVVA